MKVFKGAQRILRVLQVLWAIALLAAVWIVAADTPVILDFDITEPNGPAVPQEKLKICSRSEGDAEEYAKRETARGTLVEVRLFFQSQVTPDGRHVVPFRTEPDDDGGPPRVVMDDALSQPVKAYTASYMRAFDLPPEAEMRADTERRWLLLIAAGVALVIAAAGWGALSIAGLVVGWIVRAFFPRYS